MKIGINISEKIQIRICKILDENGKDAPRIQGY